MNTPVNAIIVTNPVDIKQESNKNIRKYTPRPKCPHGRMEYYCPLCKGDGVCKHARNKYHCCECKQEKMNIERKPPCKHNKIANCEECIRSAILLEIDLNEPPTDKLMKMTQKSQDNSHIIYLD
jgi:hypothetical protein